MCTAFILKTERTVKLYITVGITKYITLTSAERKKGGSESLYHSLYL